MIPIPSENLENLVFHDKLNFYLNGTPIELCNPDPQLTLLQYVRSIGLTGTKLGCAEGGCGACTVLVSSYDVVTRNITHSSVNACLAPLASVDGKHVITVEGIGNCKNPHPVQERIAFSHGSQCGFCTPGIVMSLYTFLRNNPNPTEEQLEESFDGNLCRCTGYRPILEAAKTFVNRGCGREGGCCQDGEGQSKEVGNLEDAVTNGFGTHDSCENGENGKTLENGLATVFPMVTFKRYDPTQELIFPPALTRHVPLPLAFECEGRRWFRPTSLTELLSLKAAYPTAKLLGGNTEVGIETKFKRQVYSVIIYIADVPELRIITLGEDGLTIGGNVTLASFQRSLEEAKERYGEAGNQGFSAYLENLRWFAGNQIRNVATLAGNIATASPISDMNPVLVATSAVLTVVHPSTGSRTIPLREFFLGYRRTALDPAEIILSIFIPVPKVNTEDSADGLNHTREFVRAYKQAKRKDDDIAIVNAGLRVVLHMEDSEGEQAWVVNEAVFAYGGMGPTTVQAKGAAEALIGGRWGSKSVLEEVLRALERDLPLSYSAPGGMPSYRRSLALGFFYKFWNDVAVQLGLPEGEGVDPQAVVDLQREVSKGLVGFEELSPDRIIGKPVPHISALKQVTGEAVYTDDLPRLQGEVYAALVLSAKPRAKIISIDISTAVASPGFVSFVTIADVPGANVWGGPCIDEPLFADEEVFCVGQTIAVVLADTQAHAQYAARSVKIEYEELPYVLTIEEAIEKQSFFAPEPYIRRGDVEQGFKDSAFIFEGESRMGAQEHFYLETQASLVVPKPEDSEFEVYSSTQNPTETQLVLSHALDIPANKIVCRVKRLGGGFGGKETRSVALAGVLAIAANKVRRPVRCMLDRDEDMITSGQRHPFLGKWKVGISSEGKVLAYEMDVYNNGGWTTDLSPAVLERSLSHSDNCYYIPNVYVRGRICKTNVHSNTAFRGFGGPQGMFLCESWMHEVADRLGMPVEKFRELNFYEEGQLTHFNMELKDWHLPSMYYQLKEEAEYERKRRDIDEFNAQNRWRKRGLSIIPTKFGISFTALHFNQAGALVHIYHDGSILLTHGGVEMGQGLHTKMCQIAAHELRVPLESVHISETSTNTVANTSATAASASSDLNGMAVKDACDQINTRLQPYREKMPEASMKELAHAAYFDRVNLSANGFYKTPDIGYKWGSNEGQMFLYFTLGVAVSEVEIDVLTGSHTTLRTDIVMDVGKTLNSAIDIGQIEGAFVQGVGLFTMEETLFLPNGQLLTRGPGNYKIPGFRDIPQNIRLSLYKGEYKHLRTIQTSKGVGEPPLFLGSSVFFAIRDAITAARRDHAPTATETEPVHLVSPATAERIRLACGDDLVTRVAVEAKEGEKGFTVFV